MDSGLVAGLSRGHHLDIVLKGKARSKGNNGSIGGASDDIGYLNILSMEGLSTRERAATRP